MDEGELASRVLAAITAEGWRLVESTTRISPEDALQALNGDEPFDLCVMTEDVHPDRIERWICDAPAMGRPYRVIEEEWDEMSDPPVRIIKRIELVGPVRDRACTATTWCVTFTVHNTD